MLCPLKTWFSKKQPLPKTARELNYFSSGLGIHDALQSLLMSDPKRFKKEKAVKYGDVEGHIDLYDQINHVPIEIKSVRKESAAEPINYHVIQLKCYMAVLDVDFGILLYQLMLHKDETPFVEHKIRTTAEERYQILHTLDVRSKLLQEALKSGDPKDLPHLGGNEEYDWLCNFCPYISPCSDMRWDRIAKEFEEKNKK